VLVGLRLFINAVFCRCSPVVRHCLFQGRRAGGNQAPPTLLERSPIGFVDDARSRWLSVFESDVSPESLHKGDVAGEWLIPRVSLIVLSPIETADQDSRSCGADGRHLLASQYSGSERILRYFDQRSIRVLDQTEGEIRQLALRIGSEGTAAEERNKDW